MTEPYQAFGLEQWLEYIQVQHWRTMELTLDRISQVWQNLGAETADFTVVVAGTNGKGSCVSLLDGVFQEAGHQTGAFTSPHLVRFNERIKINGKEASDSDICRAFRQIEVARNDISLTYFEYGTLAALLVFQAHRVGVAILEVGMGGRLDAVNMVDNNLVILTSVGIDHEQWLGTDRNQIAKEKAGVIKEQGLVVCADSEIPDSVDVVANQRHAFLLRADQDYFVTSKQGAIYWQSGIRKVPVSWRSLGPLTSPFFGKHQITNIAGVIAGLALTSEQTGVKVEHLQKGFNRAQLAARCQVIKDDQGLRPEIIIDVAHNQDSAAELSHFIGSRPCTGSTIAVFGVLEDKALAEIVEPIEKLVDSWILVTLTGERGQTGLRLGSKLDAVIAEAKWSNADSPVEGYLAALKQSNAEDRIVIFGSFYTVGDIIDYIDKN